MSKVYKIAFELAGKLESSFSSSFTQALRDMQQLENRAREIGSIRISGQTFEQIRDSAREAANELRDVERALQAIRGIRLTDQMGPLRNDLRQSSEAVQELQRRLRELEQTRGPRIDPLPDDLDDAGGQVDLLGGKFAKMAVGVTTAMAAVGGAIAGAFAAVSASDEYQQAMNKVQAATGASVENMGELKEAATNLYNMNLGENWDDLAKSLSSVKSVTKLEGAELENATRNALLMRDVFEFDVNESVKTADTMMKNFGISSEEAYNLLAQGAQNGLDKSGELLDTANEYSAYFSKLGFSANDMFNIFSSGLEAGAFSLDKIGDGIKEFGIRTKDGSKTSLDAYKAIGLNGEEMTKKFAAGGTVAQEAFLKTVKAINEVKDPVQKNAASVALFGVQAEDLEERVIKAYGNIKKSFDMTKGTMDEIAKVKFDSVGQAFQAIGRQLETGFLIPLGNAALPLLEKLSEAITSILPVVQNTFKSIGSSIGSFFGEVSENFAWIRDNGFDGEMEGVAINYAKMFGMSDSDAAAVASSLRGVFDNLTAMKDDLIGVWSSILPEIKSVFGSLQKTVVQVLPIIQKVALGIGQFSSTIVKSLVPIASYVSTKLWPIFSKVFGFIANDIVPAVSRAFTSMLPVFISVGSKIGATVSAIFTVVKPVIDALVGAFNFAFPLIKAVVLSAINSVSGIFNGLMTTLGGVLDFITGVFTGDWGKAWTGVKDVFSGVFSTLGSLLKAPINAVISLINQALQSIGSISVDIPDWVPGMGGEKLSFSFPEIPMLATGGVATGPTLAMVGEGAESEAILPLSKLDSLLSSAGSSATNGGGAGGIHVTYSPSTIIQGNASPDVLSQMQQAEEMNLRKLEQMLRDLQRDRQRRSFA